MCTWFYYIHGCIFSRTSYLLAPWSRVLLEKLTSFQLVKKFPTFHGTQRFITAFTSACHLPLSWASSLQSIPPPPTSENPGSLSPQHGVPWGCRWMNSLQYGGQLWICWISSHGQPTRDGPPAWGLAELLTTPYCKYVSCYKLFNNVLLIIYKLM